jgi:hypothetical protein
MDNLIYKYFDKNYRLTISTYSSYKLYDKVNDTDIGLKTILLSMEEIFSVSQDKIHEVFERWSDNQAIIINNRIVELQEQLYILTGKSITLSPNDINRLLKPTTKEESDVIFAPYLPTNTLPEIYREN